VALQVADALAYMHRRDLVHCDVKPQNVFLCRKLRGPRQRRVAKLIDFGLARQQVRSASLSASETAGTPIWAAPEQLSGAAPRPSMDIYSVGALLYAMLTGTIPFEGGVVEIVQQKLAGPPPPPSRFLDKPLDERLEELILRAMAVRPEQRPPTMERLIYELRTVTEMVAATSEWVGPSRIKAKSLAQTDIADALGAELCRTCTVPLFLLDGAGRLQGASPAFCQLLDESAETLVGRTLGETRVSNIYPEVEAHLADAIRQTKPLKRFLSFGTRSPNPTSMVLWVIPQLGSQGKVKRLWGTLIPL
jgi:PAS domain-containing protein